MLLIGDVDKIGYFTGQGAGTPHTDLNFAMMTTPDYLPDIDVSRYSVANAQQLDSLVQKTIKYEQNQWLNGTDGPKKVISWLQTMAVIIRLPNELIFIVWRLPDAME